VRWLTTNRVVTVTAIAMSLYQIYTAGVQQLPAMQQRTIHLCFGLLLVFLVFPLRKEFQNRGSGICLAVDYVLLFFSFFVGAYVLTQYEGISMRQGAPNVTDCVVATAAIVLVIEATRRVMGPTMCVLVLLSLGYAVFGSYLPAMFGHSGYSFERIVAQMFLGTEGILGVAVGVSATVIIIFLIFGSFLEQTGGSTAFTNLGFGLFGRFKGGAAKAAVLGSCLFGMMTGSQTANVAAVGTLTIPLMIRSGYKAMMAGAIEALASTGGMLVPPVMGAAAFIIPEIVGGSYIDVMKAALIPGLLYYTTVFTFIQVQANKLQLTKVPKAELPRLGPLMKQYGHLFLPILAMLYLLIVADVSTKLAGFWAIVVLFVVSMVRKGTRMSLTKVLAALENGPKTALVVILSCASAGIIEGVINLTGLGLRFSELLIYVAGGNMLILLVLTMLASLVIGLPLPPVTAYLILAILAAPALIKAGIDPMGAHLFVFYFGVLGNITPPSAPCSFAAAGIARTDPLKTTNLAFLISAPTFIVPYLFVYSPELTLKGDALYVAFRIITAFIAISAISMAFLGFARMKLSIIERLVLLFAAFCLIPHIWYSNAFGYLVIFVLLFGKGIYGRFAGNTGSEALMS
jgi:TRAP transporter 4TM/12TM fusion protein